MNLAFDPVAEELLLELETDGPQATVPLKQLVVKYYAPTACTVACTMDRRGIELRYYPLPDEPRKMVLEPTGNRSWRILFLKDDGRLEA